MCVNACYRGGGAHLYCSQPLQCSNQENGETTSLFLTLPLLAASSSVKKCCSIKQPPALSCRSSTLRSVCLRERTQVELVQTGSYHFLPRAAQLAGGPAVFLTVFPLSGRVTRTHLKKKNSSDQCVESMRKYNTCLPACLT